MGKPGVKGLHFVIACAGENANRRTVASLIPSQPGSAKTAAGKVGRKVNRNFSIITLAMIYRDIYNGPACKETVKDAQTQGGGVASRSESCLRSAEECRESAPNAERNRTSHVGKTAAKSGTFTRDDSVGFGVNVFIRDRPSREAGADRGCDVVEGESSFPPAPCRQDGGLTTVGFLGLRAGSGLKL
jgi:hypothetical protein